MARRPGFSLRGLVSLWLFAIATLALFNYDAASDAEIRRWLHQAAIAQSEAQPSVNPELERRLLRIGDAVLDIEVARTPAERTLGLSNRESLPEGTGMILEYEQEVQLLLWMKDMKFALDMLWFDSGRRLIHIERNVAPDSFPEAFGPKKPAMYALELPAGYAGNIGIEIGDTFAWE